MSDALSHLREIGTVSDLRHLAEDLRPAVMPNNAHLHLPPNFSAFTTIEQVIELADAQNCRIVGAANYYDYQVYREFAEAARRKNVFPLFGLEIMCMLDDLRAANIKINDPGNPGKMYICGKGIVKFEHLTPEAQRILGIIRRHDSERTARIVGKLSDFLTRRGLPNRVTPDTVIGRVALRHGVARNTVYLQERHLAQALQEYIFAQAAAPTRIQKLGELLGVPPTMKSPEDFVGAQNDLRSHLMKAGKPGFVDEPFIDLQTAIRLILELGGIPCYPVLADGANPICPFESPVEKLVGKLQARDIHTAELITGRNSVASASAYAKALRAAGITVTAGTEHNTLELIPLVPACLKNEPVPPDLQTIFYEGACVVAAHQFLAAHDQAGYVDGTGKLNPIYASSESRIEAFAKLGNAVIRKYLKAA